MSRRRAMVFAVVLVGLAGGCASTASDSGSQLAVPAGDPELGRGVFLEMGCDRCHRVVGDADLQTPSVDPPGPDLGLALTRQASAQIVSSIIAPSHQIAIEGGIDSAGESRMPDLNEELSVADLLDLVAFLGLEPRGSVPD